MSFKDISYLELWRPFCSAEQNHLCNFGRGYYEERFCEIILNLDQWFSQTVQLNFLLSLHQVIKTIANVNLGPEKSYNLLSQRGY